MQIKIRRAGEKTAVLISFDTEFEKFESQYERTKFFCELHGRNQIVIKAGKRYEYRRDGLLDEIPHLDVAQSVFIIMQENMRRMMEFFKEWDDKVSIKTFPVILNEGEISELKRKRLEEVE